ncbi:unnamed protein product [Sphagnum jensenii]|uniref:Uncharacterized protein n=1 Tax=Sphagnum jensenii TaxID=128206 RepID=A0ABP0VK02_9BRYO
MGGIGMGKTAVKRFHCRLPAKPVAYASASSALGKQRRPAPRRGQVKAAIAASWLNALTSIVYGARSVALSRSHSRWSFRSS